jgi:hypothetical protein
VAFGVDGKRVVGGQGRRTQPAQDDLRARPSVRAGRVERRLGQDAQAAVGEEAAVGPPISWIVVA